MTGSEPSRRSPWPPTLPAVSPFALPTETTGRFRMLIVFAFVAAWGTTANVVEVPPRLGITSVPEDVRELFSDIAVHGFDAHRTNAGRLIEWLEKEGALAAYGQHLWRLAFAGVAVLALAAAASRLGHAFDRRRRRRCSPLAPRVVVEIQELARRTVGEAPAEVRFRPGYVDGLMFGERGRETVVVAGQPRRLERGCADSHRAIVLHELGHWANGDLRLRERARCLLLSFSVFAALALTLAIVLRRPPWGTALAWAVENALVLALGWAMWSGLVRARESEADWRVIAWGDGEALRRRLALPGARDPGPPTATGGRSWILATIAARLRRWAPWRFHPTNGERLAAIEDLRWLFELRPGLAFLTGLALAVVASGLVPALLDWQLFVGLGAASFAGGPGMILVGLASAFLVATSIFVVAADLTTGAVGMQALRSSLAELAGARPRSGSLLRGAVLLASGLELGVWVFFQQPPRNDADLVACGIWTGALAAVLWLWLRYLRLVGRVTLGHWAGRGAPKVAVGFLRVLSAGVLGLAIWPLALSRCLLGGGNPLAPIFGSIRPESVQRLDSFRTLIVSSVIAAPLALFAAVTGVVLGWTLSRARGRSCDACGRFAEWGALVGRACRCGAPLARWATFEPSPIEPSPPGFAMRASTTTAARALVAIFGMAAIGWLPLGILSLASPFLPGLDPIEPDGFTERFLTDDPTGAFWLLTVAFVLFPAAGSGAVAWKLWRLLGRRDAEARVRWKAALDGGVRSLRLEIDRISSGPPEGRAAPSTLASSIESFLAARRDGRRGLVDAALPMASGCLALLGVVVLLFAGFVSYSGFVFEAEITKPAIRWARAAFGGFYFGWVAIAILGCAAALAGIGRDLRRWRAAASAFEAAARRELAEPARGLLGRLKADPRSLTPETARSLERLAAHG